MDIDRDHIEEAILALLFLGRHDAIRTCAALTLCEPLPIYPDQRTSQGRPDWSVRCDKGT
jgi:hypothetical protein